MKSIKFHKQPNDGSISEIQDDMSSKITSNICAKTNSKKQKKKKRREKKEKIDDEPSTEPTNHKRQKKNQQRKSKEGFKNTHASHNLIVLHFRGHREKINLASPKQQSPPRARMIQKRSGPEAAKITISGVLCAKTSNHILGNS